MAQYLFTSPICSAEQARGCPKIWGYILLYGSSSASIFGESLIPLVEGLRPFYERNAQKLASDAYEQSSFAGFVTTKAGECLLVDAFVWLRPGWEQASSWFWKEAVEHSQFASLLEHAWRRHFPAIRKNSEALNAFKTLTLKLSAYHVPIALEVQAQLGTGNASAKS
jgi:hypothetical protein